MPSILKTDLALLAACAGLMIAAFVFRENLNIYVLLAFVLATLIQLFRVIFLRGNKGTLKMLWKEIWNTLSGL